MRSPTPEAFVVGAYASLPTERAEQEAYYALLAEQPWVDGLEIPFPGDLLDDHRWLAARVAPWAASTVTAIPGTMQRVGRDPLFGLASPDEPGRRAALEFTEQLRQRVAALSDAVGRPVVAYVQLHAAPTGACTADALARSLAEVGGWDWSGARLVLEHCDAWTHEHPADKGFLPLADEIEVARQAGVGVHLNWGRSAVEGRSADLPLQHVEQAAAAGVLVGVLFSGASGEATPYGAAWADGHLPAAPDEPASLMTAERIAACAAAARRSPALAYLGAKVCVPASASLPERMAMLCRIHEATRG